MWKSEDGVNCTVKKILILIFLSISLSQNVRYIDEVFDNVIITEDVVYGKIEPICIYSEKKSNNINIASGTWKNIIKY